MLLQISSGIGGPAECELAVARFTEWLERLGGVVLNKARGSRDGLYRSTLVSIENGDAYAGTVQWVCQSPLRPGHKRKNWFIDVSLCAEPTSEQFNAGKVEFQSFKASGAGGQHVNKTESAVRAIYRPTGDVAVCMDERSQHVNKQRAVERLKDMIAARNLASQAQSDRDRWLKHSGLQRGNAGLVFEGEAFVVRRGA